MLSEKDRETLISKLREGRKIIIEALQDAYAQSAKDGGEFLLPMCSECDCSNCPIHAELLKTRKVDCWCIDESIINLTVKAGAKK